MKKSLAILAATLISAVSPSQTNAYFQNNPVWRISSGCSYDQWCVRNELYNYYLKGDTTVNSLTYKKVFKKGEGSYSPKMPGTNPVCPWPYNYIDPMPSYFLRSAGKQVFVVKANASSTFSESLLYDFNLKVGDTIPQTYNSWQTDITVTSIDSILTSDGYRKRFALSNTTHVDYIIEGIGHSKGLFEPIGPVLDCGYALQCFSMNGAAYFPSSGPSCELALGIPSDATPGMHKVFPNPFTASTTIEVGSIVSDGQLHIYDQYGRRLRTISGIWGENVNIERASLPAGIYFYEIVASELGSITGKLLIAD